MVLNRKNSSHKYCHNEHSVWLDLEVSLYADTKMKVFNTKEQKKIRIFNHTVVTDMDL